MRIAWLSVLALHALWHQVQSSNRVIRRRQRLGDIYLATSLTRIFLHSRRRQTLDTFMELRQTISRWLASQLEMRLISVEKICHRERIQQITSAPKKVFLIISGFGWTTRMNFQRYGHMQLNKLLVTPQRFPVSPCFPYQDTSQVPVKLL